MSQITWLRREESLTCPLSANSSASIKPSVPIPQRAAARTWANTPNQMALLHNQNTLSASKKCILQTRDQIWRFWQKSLDWISSLRWAAGRGGGLVAGRRWRRVSIRRCKDVASRQRNLWVCSGLAARWSSGWRRGRRGLEYQVRRHCYASNSEWKLFFGLMEKGIFFLNIFGLLSCRNTSTV